MTHDPTQPTEAERASAVATFQRWADEDAAARRLARPVPPPWRRPRFSLDPAVTVEDPYADEREPYEDDGLGEEPPFSDLEAGWR